MDVEAISALAVDHLNCRHGTQEERCAQAIARRFLNAPAMAITWSTNPPRWQSISRWGSRSPEDHKDGRPYPTS